MAMSDEHKAALAEGRQQARTIKAYLESLGLVKRGRPVNVASLEKKLARIEEDLGSNADALKRVELLQRRLDVTRALEAATRPVDTEARERGFVECAAAYSTRKGISHAAWKEAGVPPAVLKRAGVPKRD